MQTPIYAAGYYPLVQSRSDWERDLKHMKEAGITLIRTAELFCSWDQIEPEKGKYEFDWLDQFFDLCHKNGMGILLGTGTASPPYWLHEDYNDVNIVDHAGNVYPNNASYSWACLDHPGFLEQAERYLTTLVHRYKTHPALYAYQIHNEIGFPFMPHQGGAMSIYCYCQHSKEKFRQWLKNKYGNDIEKLNLAYTWGATHTRYSRFEQVEPPMAPPSAWASVTRWIDWRVFWMENVADFVKWQNDIIKKQDKKHIVTTNTFFMKSQDPFGVLMGLDPFRITEHVDVIGFDIYPGSGNKAEKKPEFSSMCLDMCRSAAQAQNKDFWLLETESGPINGWVMGPDRNVNGADLWRNVFDAIGHGSKLSLYQGFREWDFQPIHWGGLVDLDGNPTPHYPAAVDIGRTLNKIQDVVQTAITEKVQCAVLISRENAIILQGMGQEEFLRKAVTGAYKAFWQNKISVDFVTPELIENGALKNYKLVYMPLMAQVTAETAAHLQSFVQQGGILVGSARLGMLGDRGWYNHSIPCHGLKSVFGISSFYTTANTTPKVLYQQKEYSGYWHKEFIEVLEKDVQILAEFEDHTPAITMHVYGKGTAYYIGTHSDMAALEYASALLKDFLKNVAQENQLLGSVVANEILIKQGFDFHLLQNEKNFLLIGVPLPARSEKGACSELVDVELCVNRKIGTATDMVTDQNLRFEQTNKTLHLQIELREDQAAVILLK